MPLRKLLFFMPFYRFSHVTAGVTSSPRTKPSVPCAFTCSQPSSRTASTVSVSPLYASRRLAADVEGPLRTFAPVPRVLYTVTTGCADATGEALR